MLRVKSERGAWYVFEGDAYVAGPFESLVDATRLKVAWATQAALDDEVTEYDD